MLGRRLLRRRRNASTKSTSNSSKMPPTMAPMMAGSDDDAAAVVFEVAAGLTTQTRSDVSVGFVFSSCVVALHTVSVWHVSCDVAATLADHVFAGQLLQLAEAVADQNPALQAWHAKELDAPTDDEKRPAAQLVHKPTAGAATSADHEPAGHF